MNRDKFIEHINETVSINRAFEERREAEESCRHELSVRKVCPVDTPGKTIKSFHHLTEEEGCVLIFTDGTYICMSLHKDPYEDYYYMQYCCLSLREGAKLGLVSEDRLNNLEDKNKKYDAVFEEKKKKEEIKRVLEKYGPEAVKKEIDGKENK